MYTRCPECNKQHSISTEQLRASRGMMKCTECAFLFDALESISDQPIEATRPPPQSSPFDHDRPFKRKPAFLWAIGICLGLTGLIGQFFYFENYHLSQNQTFRPWLLKLCTSLDCQLPTYKNTDEISILQGSLEANGQSSYRFTAVIVNQAGFPQPYPGIRLTLLNFTGEPFAERVFSAKDYRPDSNQLAADESAHIILDIATPRGGIGGYTFKLL